MESVVVVVVRMFLLGRTVHFEQVVPGHPMASPTAGSSTARSRSEFLAFLAICHVSALMKSEKKWQVPLVPSSSFPEKLVPPNLVSRYVASAISARFLPASGGRPAYRSSAISRPVCVRALPESLPKLGESRAEHPKNVGHYVTKVLFGGRTEAYCGCLLRLFGSSTPLTLPNSSLSLHKLFTSGHPKRSKLIGFFHSFTRIIRPTLFPQVIGLLCSLLKGSEHIP